MADICCYDNEKNLKKMAGNFKNPLSILFGAFIQKIKNDHGMTLDKLGEFLGGFSASYVRMIMNGITNIAPSRAMEVMTGLNQRFGMEITLGGISNLLVAIHYLSQDLSDKNAIKQRIHDLINSELALERLLTPLLLDRVWEEFENQQYGELEKLFYNDPVFLDSLVRLLEGKLAAEEITKETTNEWGTIWMDTPSNYNDFLAIELKSLKDKIGYLAEIGSTYSLDDWEKAHKQKITNQFGIFKNKKQIMELADTGTEFFDWSYMVSLTASTFTAIFFGTDESVEQLKNELVYTIWSCTDEETRTDENARKIIESKVAVYTSNDPDRLTDLQSLGNDEKKPISEWFLYYLSDANPVGFYKETSEKFNQNRPEEPTGTDSYYALTNRKTLTLNQIIKKIIS